MSKVRERFASAAVRLFFRSLVKKGRTSRPGELLGAAPSSQARQAPPSPLRGEPARGGGA